MIENNPAIRFRKRHINTTINIPINQLEETPILISETLQDWWDNSYLEDLSKEEMIPVIIEQWQTRHIFTTNITEAIQKIKDSNPPDQIIINLVIELLNNDEYLKLEDEIDDVPMFRPFITPPKYNDYHPEPFSLDTYIYNPITKKFESLEIIDQETLIEEGFSQEVINAFYSFHQRLLQTTSKKIKLWTAQPEERIKQWNKQGFIPKNSFLTDNYERAEYYFNPEENDIIVYYKIPENQLLMTSNAFGAKEYVTLNNIEIE